jgi:hypothetical protein
MHLADVPDAARIEKDALGGRGLTRVNMRGNSDIPGSF